MRWAQHKGRPCAPSCRAVSGGLFSSRKEGEVGCDGRVLLFIPSSPHRMLSQPEVSAGLGGGGSWPRHGRCLSSSDLRGDSRTRGDVPALGGERREVRVLL